MTFPATRGKIYETARGRAPSTINESRPVVPEKKNLFPPPSIMVKRIASFIVSLYYSPLSG